MALEMQKLAQNRLHRVEKSKTGQYPNFWLKLGEKTLVLGLNK